MPGVLFLHETHLVAGYHEDAFEAAFRDGWMPTLAEDDDARLLWYCNLAHGATWSYRVVTVTAVRDGAAYERLARRTQQGDLQDWMRERRHLPARRHRQGPGAAAVVADGRPRPRVGARRRRRP